MKKITILVIIPLLAGLFSTCTGSSADAKTGPTGQEGGGNNPDSTVTVNPGVLILGDNNSTAVNLSWNLSEAGSGISSYVILDGAMTLQTITGSATTACLVSGLNPNQTYAFKVVAKNASGTQLAATNSVSYTVPDVPFKRGQPAGFLGNFAKTPTDNSLADNLAFMQSAMKNNPDIKGWSINIPWNQFHPTKDVIDWTDLEALIDLCAKNGMKCHLAFYPGQFTPQWVYDAGAKGFTDSADGVFVPVPWDAKYMELLKSDIKALAAKYNNDKRVQFVTISGHTFATLEMHACAIADYATIGVKVTPQIVLDNWKYWVDTWGAAFKDKVLEVIISQMYSGSDYQTINQQVVDYFIAKYQGRAILCTHQINGRADASLGANPPFFMCNQYSDIAPVGNEMVGSFITQPLRQGSMEMTIYNAKWMGNPYYLQYWKAETTSKNGEFRQMQTLFDQYKDITLSQMKTALGAKYVPTSTWKEGDPVK